MALLLNHSELPARWGEIINNLDLLGVRVDRPKNDSKPVHEPLFPKKPPTGRAAEEESPLSRYDPAIKGMIEEHLHGSLDPAVFPFAKPSLDADSTLIGQTNVSQASLRSAKPTWARTRPSALEPRQRVIVFVAGGATFSESRVCYDISQNSSKDVYLATSHMQTPNSFIEQVRQLSDDRSMLNLPIDREPPRANIQPSEPGRVHTQQQQQPPTAAMGNLGLGAGTQIRVAPGSANGKPQNYSPSPPSSASAKDGRQKFGKEPKEKEKDKKRHFFKF